MYICTEGNFAQPEKQIDSDTDIASENANPTNVDYLESLFAIECISPSIEATDEILERFDSGEDAEFDPVVAV